MPPLRSEKVHHRAGHSRVAAPTPAPRHLAPEDTPFGKIQPVFDGFSLAETSDWLDPFTPAPPSRHTLNPPPVSLRPSTDFVAPEHIAEVLEETEFCGRGERVPSPGQPVLPGFPLRFDTAQSGSSRLPKPSQQRRRSSRIATRALDDAGLVQSELPSYLPDLVVEDQTVRALSQTSLTRQAVPAEEAPRTEDTQHVPSSRRRKPGIRTVIALSAGGRLLTRAERLGAVARGEAGDATPRAVARLLTASTASAVNTTTTFSEVTSFILSPSVDANSSGDSDDLTRHSGPTKLDQETDLARLSVPPILPGLLPSETASVASSEPPESATPIADPRLRRSTRTTPATAGRPMETITPRVWASPALSNTTVDGKPEDWNLSVSNHGTPTMSPRSQIRPSANERTPPSASPLRKSTSVLGFLASLARSTSASEPSVALPEAQVVKEVDFSKPQSPIKRAVPAQTAASKATNKIVSHEPPKPSQFLPSHGRSNPDQSSRQTLRSRAASAASTSTAGARAPTARAVATKPTTTVTRHSKPPATRSSPRKVPAPLPSQRAPLGPARTTRSRPNDRPYARPTKASFVAAALAKLPQPGAGASSAGLPVRIRDAERARDLEIRRAMFDRAGGSEPQPPPPSRSRAVRTTAAVTGSTPGRASRARAQQRREFDAAVAARAAEREAREAEMGRLRAEVEAELDRQSRQATIVRANPVPKLYVHKV